MPSTKTVARQPTKLGELFSKSSQLAAQKEKEMARIVGTMLPVLAWLNEPVVLRPKSLGGSFSECRSVSLETGAVVFMTDHAGRVTSRPLAQFRTEECLAIFQDAYPELQRMAENKRRAVQIRPLLSLKVVLGGSRRIVDRRSYRVVVSNSGGDCRALRFSTSVSGKAKLTKPCDLGRGTRAEVDLGLYSEVDGTGTLELRVECEDVDGRELFAEEALPYEGQRWHEATLRRKN